MNLARLCCCEAVCSACASGGSCASNLGYSSVVVETTLAFSFGFPEDCLDCAGSFLLGEYAIDGATDVGSLTLYATSSGACHLIRGVVGIFPAPFAWSPPTYGPAPYQCELGGDFPVAGPWYSIRVRCITVRGVAYGECVVTLQRWSCSGFGNELASLYYRRPAGSDCKIPLGLYEFHHHDIPESWFDCHAVSGCFTGAALVWDLVPGSVTVS